MRPQKYNKNLRYIHAKAKHTFSLTEIILSILKVVPLSIYTARVDEKYTVSSQKYRFCFIPRWHPDGIRPTWRIILLSLNGQSKCKCKCKKAQIDIYIYTHIYRGRRSLFYRSPTNISYFFYEKIAGPDPLHRPVCKYQQVPVCNSTDQSNRSPWATIADNK